MKSRTLLISLVLLSATSISHGAPEDEVLSRLRTSYPNTTFDRVRRSELPGLFEVWMGKNVAYVAAGDLRYFLFGHLYDAGAGKDLTKPQDVHSAGAPVAPADIRALPVADAIRTSDGKGQATLFVFTDAACPHCRRLDAELSRLRDVTIYHFLVPFLDDALPRAIWCATDRATAFRAVMRGSEAGAKATNCENPIARNRQLAARLGVNGTPTIFLPSGDRLEGFVTASEIKRRMSSATATHSVGQKE